MSLFIHKYPHFDIKLERALRHATDGNPKHLEAPYYGVYDLWLNDLISDERDYTCCPQGALSILMEGGRNQKSEVVKRYPDFIIYHDRGGKEVEGDVRVAFIAEIKSWLPALDDMSDPNVISDQFDRRGFLTQVRDHAKMIMEQQGTSGPVWLMQCVGMFWRSGMVKDNKNLSPFSKQRRAKGKKSHDMPTFDVQWGPIQKIGERASDEEEFKFWQDVTKTFE
jgi:hypothetical protein